MIGTGPFMWGDLIFGIEYRAVRNPEWFGWDEPELGRPYLDGYKATGQGLNDASVESLFRRKEIDASLHRQPGMDPQHQAREPGAKFFQHRVSGWISTRFKLTASRLTMASAKALHLATDRQQVVDVIGSGAWKMQGPIGGAISYWALPEEELLASPGYRQTRSGSRTSPTRARCTRRRAARSFPRSGSRTFPLHPELYRHVEADHEREPGHPGRHQDVGARIFADRGGAGGRVRPRRDDWGFDNGWIDLDDWVYPYFHSTGSKNSFKVSDPELDMLLDDQRQEFDIDRRRELGYHIQRYLLGLEGDGSSRAPTRGSTTRRRLAVVRGRTSRTRSSFRGSAAVLGVERLARPERPELRGPAG